MGWKRLVRFIPRGEVDQVLIGEPVMYHWNIGNAVREGEVVEVCVLSGTPVLDPGELNGTIEIVGRLLSPVSAEEVGTIRGIGLNYASHAKEANSKVPDAPMLFMYATQPWRTLIIIPMHTLKDDSADYGADLAIVIKKTCKNVSESEALGYVLGYTATNDVSSRVVQMAQSQACYFKGAFTIRGLKIGLVVQNSSLSETVFNCAELANFLLRGTTLPAGTESSAYLHDGDKFVVEIWPHVGSLYLLSIRDREIAVFSMHVNLHRITEASE
ncbi:hypothetical protein F5Y11DRAFT_358209 [Daldinia sp. FL1419]|nr:hypothetical protein F5Y11DRAFT_358209 [Daldinia sp. FL1419]